MSLTVGSLLALFCREWTKDARVSAGGISLSDG